MLANLVVVLEISDNILFSSGVVETSRSQATSNAWLRRRG